ncbi:hypothetical protein [Pseudodesulfovibrio pelocollis]|uniref:hypothetical protein n=1 Tax=Pseudodesulfovibrio pelocollis TaxID=3051432 RepID=UPI00255AAD98|nr:hypothetical protein [Pseudodesulfovibrio sp. SB368]
MRRFGRILVAAVAVVILTLSLALAGAKFTNKDTAKDRRTNTFGTDQGADTATTTFGTNEAGDSTLKVKPAPKPEEVDWYDKVIITVNPDTKWPTSGTSSSTRTRTAYDNATDTETRTTTTEERNW